MALLLILSGLWLPQLNYAQAPEPYRYISFDGQQLTLYPYTGQHIYDNAKAESFLETLKREEVYLNQYETFADAERHIMMSFLSILI